MGQTLESVKAKIKELEHNKRETPVQRISEIPKAIITENAVYIPIEKDVAKIPVITDVEGYSFVNAETISVLPNSDSIIDRMIHLRNQLELHEEVLKLLNEKKRGKDAEIFSERFPELQQKVLSLLDAREK